METNMQCVSQGECSFKRKRNSSAVTNLNVPLKEEKCQKLERLTVSREEQSSTTQMGESVPLSELNIITITSSRELLTLEAVESPLRSDSMSEKASLNNLMLDLEQITDDSEKTKNTLAEAEPKRKLNKCKVNSPVPGTSKTVNLPKCGGKICPLLSLDCYEESVIWDFLNKKDVESCKVRNPNYSKLHPDIDYSMRSILLEWILEVCAGLALLRETYFLTVDLLDRYLSSTEEVKKNLQLIGISCLFLATKIEEIYPLKVAQLTYLTDENCAVSDILAMELKIMETLKWPSCIISPNAWVNILLKIIDYYRNNEKKQQIMCYPLNPTHLSQLLVLCSLDEGFLKYSYKTIAVSSLYISYSKGYALMVSGMDSDEILPCVIWMESFWQILDTNYGADVGYDSDLELNNQRNPNIKFNTLQNPICEHNISLDQLKAAQTILKEAQQAVETLDILMPTVSTKEKCDS